MSSPELESAFNRGHGEYHRNGDRDQCAVSYFDTDELVAAFCEGWDAAEADDRPYAARPDPQECREYWADSYNDAEFINESLESEGA